MSTTDGHTRQGLVVWASKKHGALLHRALKDLFWLDSQGLSAERSRDEIGFPCYQERDLEDDEKHALSDLFPHPFQHAVHVIQLQGPSLNPHSRLERRLSEWMVEHGGILTSKQRSALPTKWERLGDLVVLNQDAFRGNEWLEAPNGPLGSNNSIWKEVANALGGERLARQAHIMDNALRTPQLELLHGTQSWVDFLDHGVHFGFDASSVMFSSGNVTERHRIGGIPMKGETVVDAYAGAGYYTLPMLVRSGAAHVHACEMNPASIEGLRWAAEKNGVLSNLTVHEGDNQDALPKLAGIADRCHLGLLPSSKAVWSHALACLKPSGGMIHIHMNVEKTKLKSWQSETILQLEGYAKALGRSWLIEIEHLERVKSYSPGVIHIVLDVRCSPR
jgi:tRNA wybutosine-synthesizing protein 3